MWRNWLLAMVAGVAVGTVTLTATSDVETPVVVLPSTAPVAGWKAAQPGPEAVPDGPAVADPPPPGETTDAPEVADDPGDSAQAAAVKLGEVPEWVGAVELAVSAREMLAHVRFLASEPLRGRGSFTMDERIAAHFVACEFEKYGLRPGGDNGTFFQTFLLRGQVSQNVIALLPGTSDNEALAQEVVVVGAHVDHLGVVVPRDPKWGLNPVAHPGADDNASGVAVLLALAKTLAERGGLRRTVIFVGFGAEEAGLVGSRFFVAHPPIPLPRLAMMLNLDMMGHPVFLNQRRFAALKGVMGIRPGRGFGVIGTGTSPALKPITQRIAEQLDLPLYAPEDFPTLRRQIAQMLDSRSDAAPFERQRIPFLFFSTSEHDNYHSPADTTDAVCAETMRLGATLALRVLVAIDAADDRPTFHAVD